ncbi:uncharacterized protein [Solanum lycopersicum]|uniref:uncharacterized protein n=1 Tax=Solanum lycopersicum TaxID=4081 RepID=UPI003749A573
MTNLCQKVEKIEIEVKELKANGQQHDQKHADLRRTTDGKQPEIEGDDGKLRKTHNNVCSDTTAGISKRTSEKPKNTNLNQLFAKPVTQKPQMQIPAEPQTSTYAELQLIFHDLIDEDNGNEAFQVAAMIEKLPPS